MGVTFNGLNKRGWLEYKPIMILSVKQIVV